jgi:hypothetical protein
MTGRRFREALITHKNRKEQKKHAVRDLDPLKQGLKHPNSVRARIGELGSRPRSTKTRIET